MLHPANVPLGLYIDGTSVFHRTDPKVKMLILSVFLIATAIWIKTWQAGLVCVAVVLCAYAFARIPASALFRQMMGAFPILAFFGLILWWRAGWETALTSFSVLLAAILAAILFTLTTRITAVMDTVEQALLPLARFGFPAETVALALALTLRLIPLQVQSIAEVLEARKARGASWSVTAFGVPVVIRSIGRAQAVGDALIARGAGD
ncbi:energy-coupling factor transporter transmembrane component T family protein [Corynebacterium sp. H78]|uniref:energy-coupling factor transporter transmembrane component T family protein n=1 Tax=Corynebacterium sp. H78 TaxID=3133417 RepID=UPI00309C386E